MKKSLFPVVLMLLLATASTTTAQIQLSFSVVQPSCHGYTDGTLTANPTGGSAPYQYAWSNGQTTQTCFGIGAGVYTVTVTDAAQLTTTGNMTVLEPSALSVSISANDLGCDGVSGTLTATAFGGTSPYTFAWGTPSGPAAGETVAVAAPGNYFVTATDAKGCANIKSFSVAGPISVDAIATDIPCSYYPNGGAVNAVVTGGATPYSFLWSNGSTEQMQTQISADNYVVTVTGANGCTATDGDVVDIPNEMVVNVVWVTPACNGNNGSAIVQATGGTPPYTHTWTPGGLSGASQSGLAPGIYYVCTFDANGCQKDLNVEIPVATGLDVQLVVSSAICQGNSNGSVTAIVNPPGNYFYQWNPAGPNGPQLTGLSANTLVTVTVTDPATGCTGTASATISAHDVVDLSVTAEDIPCAGGTGSATAVASGGTPGYHYTWLSGNEEIGEGPSISGLGPGAYMVTVVDEAGCTAQSVANIGIESAPDAQIGGVNVLVCGDSASTVQFTNLSTDPFNQIVSLVWTVTGASIDTVINQQNQIAFLLPVDEDIVVQLIVTSANGCSDTTAMPYNVPGYPDFSLSLDTTSLNCLGNPIGIIVVGGDSSYHYVWDPSVTLNPDPLHVTVDPDVNTMYTLTATDGNFCTATASIEVGPGGGIFQLDVSQNLIQTCDATATLWANASLPATIVWTDEDGHEIPGDTITVEATPNPVVYTVTATTLEGCTQTNTVTVSGHSIELSIDSTSTLTDCAGVELPLGVVVSPAGAVLQYDWSVTPPATISDPNAPNPTIVGPEGAYTVTVIVSNDFCSDTLEFPVNYLPNHNLDGDITADLCRGREVRFFNNSGMPGTWDFGDNTGSDETNPVHTYASAGDYMVIFTPNESECTPPWDSMIQVMEAALGPIIQNDYVVCVTNAQIQFNGSINLTGNFNWSWTFSNGTPGSSNLQNPLVTFTEEGQIIATLTVSDTNKCEATVSIPVEIVIVDDHIAEQIEICPNDTIQLNADGIDPTADYVWTASPEDPELNPNDPNPTVSPEVTTTYTVQIEQGLCSITYTTTVIVKDGLPITVSNDTVVCNDTPLLITAHSAAGAIFEWSTDPSFGNVFSQNDTVIIPPTPDGVYYVRVVGAFACPALDSVKISLESINIQAGPNEPHICLGDEAELLVTNLDPDQNVSYDWSPDLPDVPNPIVSPDEDTNYSVIVTNQYGCADTLDFSVAVTWVTVDAQVVGHDTICPGMHAHLLATQDGNGTFYNFSWTPAGSLSNPNSAETDAEPTQDETYTVTVSTDNGCTATDDVQVFFMATSCENPYIFVPKAFTPNGDMKNDFFIMRGADIAEVKFVVWDRWGEIVYETNDPEAKGWDGTFNGKESTPDSYAWYLWCTCGNGDTYEAKGNVTLLK